MLIIQLSYIFTYCYCSKVLECLCVRLAVALGFHFVDDTSFGAADGHGANAVVAHCCPDSAAFACDLVVFDAAARLAVAFSAAAAFVVVVAAALCHRDAYSGIALVLRARMAVHWHFPSNLDARGADSNSATNLSAQHATFLAR